MPGSGGTPFWKMSTLSLCAWACLTFFVATGLTWTAFTEPTPIHVRAFFVLFDCVFLVGWVGACLILLERWVRRRRRV